MKRIMLMAVVLMLFLNPAYGERLHIFQEALNPGMLVVDSEHIYIADRHSHSIYIYDINDFLLKKKLFRKGEGPGEFVNPPSINIHDQKLFFFNSSKVNIYSLQLQAIREQRTGLPSSILYPLGRGFVELDHHKTKGGKMYIALRFYNNAFKLQKEILVKRNEYRPSKYLLFPVVKIQCRQDRVYLYDPDLGFQFSVFNESGKKLGIIKIEYPLIPSKTKHKKRHLKFILDLLGPRIFNKFKKRKQFERPLPLYLPHLSEFWVKDWGIIIKTFDVSDDISKDLYLFLDSKGKVLGQRWLPYAVFKRFFFHEQRFYYLKDNEEGEGWELHMQALLPFPK